ncbi:PREDICTED: cyclin-dependent protein kinase inhibitor SMR3-like [Tarenaya hassleriana]|uniref:cyclin-dependent protein kinase inhibitor SMR3-like n=1 Tax=Tarenaya hassleriana TaxID=28532 RepID=UPI00053C388B|nr:PREDICTED: cyclin-dependent protein kinase inhibitor SMR3-like [Tarenaya hassleriana]
MSETIRSEQLVTCKVSSPENGRRDEESGSKSDDDRADEVSDKPMFENFRKRKRSEEDDNVRRESEDDEDGGFKTPTRPENRVPEITECPAAPRKQRPELSDISGRKRGSCRRRLDFLPEDIINPLLTDLQRSTRMMKMEKKVGDR